MQLLLDLARGALVFAAALVGIGAVIGLIARLLSLGVWLVGSGL